MFDKLDWSIVLAFVCATLFAWYKYIYVPRLIRRAISKIPNFCVEKFHLGDDCGVAFDFSNRTFVYAETGIWNLFHASEIKVPPHHNWIKTPTNHGSINESKHHVQIRLRNDSHPEIRAYFRTRYDAQRCENSFDRLFLEETAFQDSLLAQREAQNATKNEPANSRESDSLDDVDPALVREFVEHLTNAGFTRNDGYKPARSTRLEDAVRLLWADYGKIAGPGHPEKLGRQKVIRKALEPFFLRAPGEGKNFGYAFHSIRKFVSDYTG